MKSFLGNFYRPLAIFSGHTGLPGLFLFILIFSIQKTNVLFKKPDDWIRAGAIGVGSDRSANWATTTAHCHWPDPRYK